MYDPGNTLSDLIHIYVFYEYLSMTVFKSSFLGADLWFCVEGVSDSFLQ